MSGGPKTSTTLEPPPPPPPGRDREPSFTVEAAIDAAARVLRDRLATESRLPAGAVRSPEALAGLLELELGREGVSPGDLCDTLGRLLEATPSPASRRFFNQLYGGRDAAATLAEIVAAFANTSMYTFKVGGAQLLVERAVVGRMLDLVGFHDGEGILAPGGSISNLMAMLVARNEVHGSIREDGLGGRRLTSYTSAASHYSVRKNAGVLGLGRASVREIPTDREGRMSVGALEERIADDITRGELPFFVNATAGTTVLGAFDPLSLIATVAERYGLWLHVDAALGGSVALSARHRHLLHGCGRADSLAWNAHKMMGVPMPCAALLLRRRGLLFQHFNETADYLFQGREDRPDPGTQTLQCGRRNDALKLWATWKRLGDRGLERRIDRLFELAAHAARRISRSAVLRLLHQPQSINVCCEAPGRSSAAICERLDREGRLLVGHGTVDGVCGIRLVLVNPELEEADVDRAVAEIEDVAASLPAG